MTARTWCASSRKPSFRRRPMVLEYCGVPKNQLRGVFLRAPSLFLCCCFCGCARSCVLISAKLGKQSLHFVLWCLDGRVVSVCQHGPCGGVRRLVRRRLTIRLLLAREAPRQRVLVASNLTTDPPPWATKLVEVGDRARVEGRRLIFTLSAEMRRTLPRRRSSCSSPHSRRACACRRNYHSHICSSRRRSSSRRPARR